MNVIEVNEIVRKSMEMRRSGQHHEAIRIITDALQVTKHPRLYFARGRNFDLIDTPIEAVSDFTSAIDMDPGNAKYLLNRGYILADSLFQTSGALADFEKVIEIEPGDSEAHRMASFCLLDFAMPELALEHALAAQRLAPPDDAEIQASIFSYIGHAKLLLREFHEAAESYSRAVELDPDAGHHWSGLGRALERSEDVADLESAVGAYSKAIQIDPKRCSLFTSRGELRLKLGDFADAE